MDPSHQVQRALTERADVGTVMAQHPAGHRQGDAPGHMWAGERAVGQLTGALLCTSWASLHQRPPADGDGDVTALFQAPRRTS
jgi:hypothetical protein